VKASSASSVFCGRRLEREEGREETKEGGLSKGKMRCKEGRKERDLAQRYSSYRLSDGEEREKGAYVIGEQDLIMARSTFQKVRRAKRRVVSYAS
jgi:hypothetical protein